MELVVEVYSRAGRLRERTRITDDKASVGRSYNNQVILSDQYVCPTHVALEYYPEDRHWKLFDLSSKNGTHLIGNGKIVQPHIVRSGDEIEIGHTRLRLLLPDHEVAETKLMPPGRMLADYFNLPIVAVAMLIITMATFALNQYLSLGTHVEWKELILEGMLVLSVPFIWACIWALIGRVAVHDARFSFHLSMGSVMVLVSFVLTVLMEYLRFGLNSLVIIDWAENILEGVVLAALLVAALWMSTNMMRYKRWLVGNAIAWGLIGFALFYDYARYDEYNQEYDWYVLKPPFAQIASSESVEGFVAEMDRLIQETEKDIDPPQ